MYCRSKKEVMPRILSHLRTLSKLVFSSIFSRSFSWCWHVSPTNLSPLCYGICDIFSSLYICSEFCLLTSWCDESGFEMVMRADSKWSGALVRDRASGGICLCCLSTRNFSIFSYFRVCSIEWVGVILADRRDQRKFQSSRIWIFERPNVVKDTFFIPS